MYQLEGNQLKPKQEELQGLASKQKELTEGQAQLQSSIKEKEEQIAQVNGSIQDAIGKMFQNNNKNARVNYLNKKKAKMRGWLRGKELAYKENRKLSVHIDLNLFRVKVTKP